MPRRLLLLCLFVAAASAQTANKDRVYAIKDARIVVAPGQVIEKGTVVVRRGRIEAVAADAAIPVDADVIDGAGQTVYAGLIDAFSALGRPQPVDAAPPVQNPAPAPEGGRRRQGGGAGAPAGEAAEGSIWALPETNRRGVSPETSAALDSVLTEETGRAEREAGILAACITPRDNLLAGKSAVTLLGPASARDAVLLPDVFSTVGLEGRAAGAGFGSYPSTTMGNIAHVRQFFMDAQHYRAAKARFETSGQKTRRPPFDAALEAVQPLLERRMKAAFIADTEPAILRALEFAKEFGLHPIIVGGAESWKVAARLKAENVDVLLAVAFGEEPKSAGTDGDATSRPTAAAGQGPGGPGGRGRLGGRGPGGRRRGGDEDAGAERGDFGDPRGRRAAEEGAPNAESRPSQIAAAETQPTSAPASQPTSRPSTPPEEPVRVTDDKTKKWKERASCAAVLAKHGVRFVFTSRGTRSPREFLTAVQKSIDHGLSKDSALAALTNDSAAMLGVDRMIGTVEVGKIANLLIASAEFGTANFKVRTVFADGQKTDLAPAGAPAGAGDNTPPDGSINLTGKWTLSSENSRMLGDAVLNLTQKAEVISGSMETQMGSMPITSGKLAGKKLTITIEMNFGGRTRNLDITGTVESKDVMVGTVDIMGGTQEWKAVRSPREGEEK